jgi:hypothetical protein
MATFRNRNGKWQARIQIKGHDTKSKTFFSKSMPSATQTV